VIIENMDNMHGEKLKIFYYYLFTPITGLKWPGGFQEIKVPRFHDNGAGWW